MLVRGLTGQDAGAYAALRREMLADAPWAFAGSLDDDPSCHEGHVRGQLALPENVILGAWDGGRLVGGAGVLRNTRVKFRHSAFVWGVYVTPAWRGKGVARRLMESAIGVARGWPGVTVLRLSAGERSHGARALYGSLGFVVWGVEEERMRLPGQGEGQAEYHMALMLEGSVRGCGGSSG